MVETFLIDFFIKYQIRKISDFLWPWKSMSYSITKTWRISVTFTLAALLSCCYTAGWKRFLALILLAYSTFVARPISRAGELCIYSMNWNLPSDRLNQRNDVTRAALYSPLDTTALIRLSITGTLCYMNSLTAVRCASDQCTSRQLITST